MEQLESRVVPSGSPPVAVADTYNAHAGHSLTVAAASGVLANDTDAEHDPLTASVVSYPSHGMLSFSSNGGFTYTPISTFVGDDSFTYKANDGTSNSNTATVTLHVTDAAPVAAADSYSTGLNQVLTVPAGSGVLANDTDADGDALTASTVSLPSHGMLSFSANGSFTYHPSSSFRGIDSFTYTASDGTLSSATTTVTIAVDETAPVAGNDSYTVQGSSLSVSSPGVLTNDTDAEGDPLTASLVGGPSHGSLTLNANGSFTYTPTAGFTGTDSFTYQANDGFLNSTAATVTLTVPPVVSIDSLSVTVGSRGGTAVVNFTVTLSSASASTVTVGYSTADGTATAADNDYLPASGGLSFAPGETSETIPVLVYGQATSEPAENFFVNLFAPSGATLGGSGQGTATVIVTVPLPPTLTNPGDQTNAIGDVISLPIQASDPAGASLFFGASDLPPGLSINTQTGAMSGTLIYSGAELTGDVFPVTMTATDTLGGSASQAFNWTVTGWGALPPLDYQATHDQTLTEDAPGVLATVSGSAGGSLTAVLGSGPSHGSLTLNADGSFTYTPDLHFVGSDSFTYSASDGTSQSPTGTVTITVANSAPVADDIFYGVPTNVALQVPAPGVLGGATDADGDAMTATLASGPSHGTLTLNADGSFTYTPDTDYAGTDQFSYLASDGVASSAPATITLNVHSDNGAPVANDDSYDTPADQTLTVSDVNLPTWVDVDPDGDALTATLVTTTAHGTLVFNSDSSFVYTPASGFVGTDTFTYTVSDGSATSNVATVTINVSDDAPVVLDQSYVAHAGQTFTTGADGSAPGVLEDDYAPDDWTVQLQAQLVQSPQHGTLSQFEPDGSFVYVPDAGFVGDDTFTYQASDGVLTSTVATVTISVTDDGPIPTAANYFVAANGSLTGAASVLANDGDFDGDSLQASLVSGPSHGTLTFRSDGTFDYTPQQGYVGADSFVYQATDGTLTSSATTVSLTVTDVPVGSDQEYVLAAGSNTLSVSSQDGLLTDDFLPGAGSAVAQLVSGPVFAPGTPQAGTPVGNLTLAQDGSFTFQRPSGVTDTIQFTYQIVQGSLGSWPFTVVIPAIQVTPRIVVEEAEFDGGKPVLADVRGKVPGNEYKDSQWKDTDHDGLTTGMGEHAYPYTIAQDQLMILNAALYFDEADKPVFTSAKDKGNLQVRAQVLKAADPTQVVFTFLKKNPRVSNSYLTLNATADRTFAQAGATASDFGYYATSGLTILYSYSLDGGKTWFGSATTQNKVYVTLAKPKTPYLYETVLYYGSTSRASTLSDLPGAVAAFLGERETTRVDGTPMYYYGDWGTPNVASTGALLNGADGRCGTWAKFFIDILRAQGLGTDSTTLLGITPVDDKEGFMVPNWQFNGDGLFKDKGLTLPADYKDDLAKYPYVDVPDTSATPWPPETQVPVDQTPYYKNNAYQWILPSVKGDPVTQEDVKDQLGVPGQNSSDPTSLFGDHAIVKVVIAGQTKYYDPSYGTIYDSLLDFNNSLAGFYIGMDINEKKFNDANPDKPLDLNRNMAVDTVHVLAMKKNKAAANAADMSIKATDDKYNP